MAALNKERADGMSPLRAWSWANWSRVRWSEEKANVEGDDDDDDEEEEEEEEVDDEE